MKAKTLALIALMMLWVPAAHASPITFTAALSGANENPANASPATGLATIVLDPTAQTLTVSATFSGLGSTDTMAHIHCCASAPFNNTNIGVATTLPAFSMFPLGVTSGTYGPMTFDLTASLIYNPAFVTLQGGTIAGAEAALIAGIEGQRAYFNIHTVNFPGGEIRGFLNPVPLPAALPLLATCLGALGLLGWRRKKKAAA
jgi:hypothetical protein